MRRGYEEMDKKLNAMKVSSKVIMVLMKIGYIASIVAICLCAAGIIFMLATGGKTSFITSSGIRFVMTDETLASPEKIAAVCSVVLILTIFLYTVFLLTYRIFKDINATGNVFDEKHVKTIKIIGILLASMSVFVGLADTIATLATGIEVLGAYKEAPGIGIGAIVFCLAFIYDYGCALQKKA